MSPACLGTSGSVRQMARPQGEMRALEVQTFWPSRTQWSPSRGGTRRQTGQVAPGSRLREQLAAELVGAQEAPDEALLLLRRAVDGDRRGDEVGRHREQLVVVRHVEVGLELGEGTVVLGGEPGAAVLDRARRWRRSPRPASRGARPRGRRGARSSTSGSRSWKTVTSNSPSPQWRVPAFERPDRAQPLLGPRRERGDIFDVLGAFDLLYTSSGTPPELLPGWPCG